MRILSSLSVTLPLLAGAVFLQPQAQAQLFGDPQEPGTERFEDSIPIELARFFAGGADFYRSLPEQFPELELPPGLEVMGSMDRRDRQQVLFRSALGAEDAERALAQAFVNQGWNLLQGDTGGELPGSGEAISLCHDRLGQVWFNAEEGVENRVYLRRAQPDSPDFSCQGRDNLFSFED